MLNSAVPHRGTARRHVCRHSNWVSRILRCFLMFDDVRWSFVPEQTAPTMLVIEPRGAFTINTKHNSEPQMVVAPRRLAVNPK